ncbi:MAG: Rho termination factor N-terminal domain-containing protein [Solirubrobacterales bacterium]
MTKAELENKPLAELHALAADAGVERYRMLTRAELIERLSGGKGADTGGGAPARQPRSRNGEGGGQRDRSRRRRRPPREREQASDDETAPEPAASAPKPSSPDRDSESASSPDDAAGTATESTRPRRRRRRRFGRRGKQGVNLQSLLLPPEAGRQAVLSAESREACTALLRSVAADLAAASKGPDPVALLIDPSPEELADWKRDAPQAEIVAAGQPRHASDALAQAAARAGKGEDIILLVDSLTRLAEATDTDTAKEFFDAGRTQGTTGGGSLTVVAALEAPSN